MNNLSKYYDDKLINGEFTTVICTNNNNVEKALSINKTYKVVQSKLRKDCYAIKIKEYKTNIDKKWFQYQIVGGFTLRYKKYYLKYSTIFLSFCRKFVTATQREKEMF